MKKFLPLSLAIFCYFFLIVPFTAYMRNRPFIEKLGYIPQAEVLKFISADQKIFVADALVMKTLFYFGSLLEKSSPKLQLPPDYFSIYKTIETGVKLDPYNMDAYYFAQSVMAWDAKRVKEANTLLVYGMKYRDWDYYLPFFAGFNYAYFLKDYANAAKYYKRASELSGVPLYANLAGRYMYESGQTDFALSYLIAMEKNARDPAIKKTFRVRIAAFLEVKKIESAVAQYKKEFAARPNSIDELLLRRYLKEPPVDPYGGAFYLDENEKVRSTSKFAYGDDKKSEPQR